MEIEEWNASKALRANSVEMSEESLQTCGLIYLFFGLLKEDEYSLNNLLVL